MLNLIDAQAAQDLYIAVARRALADAESVRPTLQAEAQAFLTQEIPDWRAYWTPRAKTNRDGRKKAQG